MAAAVTEAIATVDAESACSRRIRSKRLRAYVSFEGSCADVSQAGFLFLFIAFRVLKMHWIVGM